MSENSNKVVPQSGFRLFGRMLFASVIVGMLATLGWLAFSQSPEASSFEAPQMLQRILIYSGVPLTASPCVIAGRRLESSCCIQSVGMKQTTVARWYRQGQMHILNPIPMATGFGVIRQNDPANVRSPFLGGENLCFTPPSRLAGAAWVG